MSHSDSGYDAATAAVALHDRSHAARLEVKGPDRAKFLHNLTTNDVKRLAVGAGCEAFVTSPQGKTLGFVTLLASDDRILLRTAPGGLEHVLPHLRKYGVFDEVELDDISDSTSEYHLVGPQAEELVLRCGGSVPSEKELDHATSRIANCDVRIVRESPTGRPGLTVIFARADGNTVLDGIRSQGLPMGLAELDAEQFETLRIEAGTPAFGKDVLADNLPQELDRDARAISFVKGCYLGQETVARLDALGHVNKVLKGLRINGLTVPAPGTPLESEGKLVGSVTSSAFSPGWNSPIALVMIRVVQARAGTTVQVALPEGTTTGDVVDLPMLPR